MLRFANPENDTMDDIMLSPFFRVAEVINRAAEHGCLSVLGLDFVGNRTTTTSLSATDLESSVARLDGLLDFSVSVTVPCPFRLGPLSCATGEHWKMLTGEVM